MSTLCARMLLVRCAALFVATPPAGELINNGLLFFFLAPLLVPTPVDVAPCPPEFYELKFVVPYFLPFDGLLSAAV